MKDFAMMVWNMEADDFSAVLILLVLGFFIWREVLTEINVRRVKRFNKFR